MNTDDVVVRSLLERNAQRWPTEQFVAFEDGTTWTFREARDISARAANAYRQAGIRQGDRVAVLLGNGPDYLRAWWGLATLGAVLSPINTAARGNLLAHILRVVEPTAVVTDDRGLATLSDVDESGLVPATRLAPDDLDSSDLEPPALDRPIEQWDTAALITTSGTTGPSKVAVNTYRHALLGGSFITGFGRGREDTLLVDLPLFHGAAFWLTTGCLGTGTGIVVRSAPTFTAYWETARDTGATMSLLLGSMVPFLLAQPVRPAEREHCIRAMRSAPLPSDLPAFQDRFGVAQISTSWGMSEVPAALESVDEDVLEPGYCGRQRAGFECRVVEEHGIEVPNGVAGELVVRSEHPWSISHEYLNNPEATARAWRNGWFHTGDLVRVENGRYYFVDRLKDSIRRRGENISAVEVENEIRSYPGIEEVVCVPFRHPDFVEDEVKAWITVRDGETIDFSDLLRHCVDRLPYFMVPRYLEVTDQLPLTMSAKVKKFELRERGNGDHTWDREAHGFRVTRDGIQVAAAR